MKISLFLLALLFVSIFSFSRSFAQQQDNQRQKQIMYYSKILTTNQDTSMRVIIILSTYNESLIKVVGDNKFSEEAKRTKIEGLIEEKNKQLGLLLSPAQQEKIIPITERKRDKPGK